jgi:hypothetical protein
MVLFCITGELGAGKTMALTYLAYTNWKKGRKIFSNYLLYGFPFTLVRTIPNLDRMKEGFFCGDELWNWLETAPVDKDGKDMKMKANFIPNILLKSRKRSLTLAYTAQTIEQVKSRIRKVNDFTAYPMLNANEDICKVIIFRGGKPSMTNVMKGSDIYFYTEPVMSMYDTYEEVPPICGEDTEPYEELNLSVLDNPAFIRRMHDMGIEDNSVIEQEGMALQEKISGMIL